MISHKQTLIIRLIVIHTPAPSNIALPYHLLSSFFKNLPTPFSTLSTLSLTLYLPLKLSFRSCPGCGGTQGIFDFSPCCAALSCSVGRYSWLCTSPAYAPWALYAPGCGC